MSKEQKFKDYTEYLRDDLLSDSSSLLDFEFTDSLDYDSDFEVDALGTTTGGIYRTNRSPTRVEINNIDNRIYIYQDGEIRAAFSGDGIGFFTPAGVSAGAIYGFGTGSLGIDGDLIPGQDGAFDIGSGALQYANIYLVNAPIVSSDKRFKRDIQDLKYGINEIKKLQPVSYKRKDDTTHLGLIAQDVQNVIPEAVQESVDGVLGIRYENIIPVLINSVRELSQEIDGLKAKIIV